MARYRVGLETRERILAATRALLADVGFEGVTLKAITDHAGVGAGSFYNLFDSKEDVILEVITDAITAVDPDPAGAGTDTVEELVRAYVRFITESGMARIYLQLAIGRGLTDRRVASRVLKSHHRRVYRFADALRREHPDVTEVEAEERAEALLATLTGYALTWLLDADFDFRQHADRLLTEKVLVR